MNANKVYTKVCEVLQFPLSPESEGRFIITLYYRVTTRGATDQTTHGSDHFSDQQKKKKKIQDK